MQSGPNITEVIYRERHSKDGVVTGSLSQLGNQPSRSGEASLLAVVVEIPGLAWLLHLLCVA